MVILIILNKKKAKAEAKVEVVNNEPYQLQIYPGSLQPKFFDNYKDSIDKPISLGVKNVVFIKKIIVLFFVLTSWIALKAKIWCKQTAGAGMII